VRREGGQFQRGDILERDRLSQGFDDGFPGGGELLFIEFVADFLRQMLQKTFGIVPHESDDQFPAEGEILAGTLH